MAQARRGVRSVPYAAVCSSAELCGSQYLLPCREEVCRFRRHSRCRWYHESGRKRFGDSAYSSPVRSFGLPRGYSVPLQQVSSAAVREMDPA